MSFLVFLSSALLIVICVSIFGCIGVLVLHRWVDHRIDRKIDLLTVSHAEKWRKVNFKDEVFNSSLGRLDRELEEIKTRLNGRMVAPSPYRPARNRKGFVYLLRGGNGHWKIGRTSSPQNRLKTFEVKLPFEVQYECLIETTDMYSLERNLHLRFWGKRVSGEWFDLEPSDIEYIRSLAGGPVNEAELFSKLQFCIDWLRVNPMAMNQSGRELEALAPMPNGKSISYKTWNEAKKLVQMD